MSEAKKKGIKISLRDFGRKLEEEAARETEMDAWAEADVAAGANGHTSREFLSDVDARKEVAESWDRPTHEHIWDRAARLKLPVVRDTRSMNPLRPYILYSPYDEDAVDWQGPVECECGRSAWLTDGFVGGRVTAEPAPEVGADAVPDDLTSTDVLAWLLAFRAKLDAGHEPTEAEQERFNAIGAALVTAIKPVLEALRSMWDQFGSSLMSMIELIPAEEREVLLKLADAFDPAPNISVEIVSDEDQSYTIPPGDAIVRGQIVQSDSAISPTNPLGIIPRGRLDFGMVSGVTDLPSPAVHQRLQDEYLRGQARKEQS